MRTRLREEGENLAEGVGAHARRCTAGVRARLAATTRRRGSSGRGGGRASGARAPRLEASSSVGQLLRPLGAPPTAPSGTGMAKTRHEGHGRTASARATTRATASLSVWLGSNV